MRKSAEAFQTIGEVASGLGLEPHVLRFWESKFQHIQPVQKEGGRRLYRPEDVRLLTNIKHLLHNEGMTIRGVQKLIRDRGVDALRQTIADTNLTASGDTKKLSATELKRTLRDVRTRLSDIRELLSD